MSNTITFRTQNQREYDKITDKLDKENKILNESLNRKHRKLEMGGQLSETEINEMFSELGGIIRNSRERDRALERLSPEVAARVKSFEEEAFQKAAKAYLKEEHGLEIIK